MFAFGVFFLGSVQCSQDPQVQKNTNFALKLGPGTIHTFKNYFATVFSTISFQFSTINGIQTDP